MVGEHLQQLSHIRAVSEYVKGPEVVGVLHHFLAGNSDESRSGIAMSAAADQLFRAEGAIAHLNAASWSKALALTDVYDAMPQARRNQWNEQIRNPEGVKKGRGTDEWQVLPLPDFDEETVRATLRDLLASRAKFLAERVDGIFRALSGEHVTNSPAAFGKRMIIAHLTNSWGSTCHDRVGYINDLRCVIAKFMGRDEPHWGASSAIVEFARTTRRGEWVTLDGGALRLRAYKCGTAHLEVHPDMAWRLNCVLANLYPQAIPPEFRQKPKKQAKSFVMMGRPLPFSVLAVLENMEKAYRLVANNGADAWNSKFRREDIPNAMAFKGDYTRSSPAREEAEKVLAYIGGVKVKNDRNGYHFQFDYNPRDAIKEIVCSGCLPDQKAHQYYPTPTHVAEVAIELAQIGAHDICLEPSAGTGGLADLMPKDRTRCVEISPLHCKVLESKGLDVVEADFLKYVSFNGFDRIVMNPPFSEGRWQAHLEHAAAMLAPSGRLVAILPASAKGKDVLHGWSCDWSQVFKNEFAGTSVDVVILAANRSSANISGVA